MKLGPVHLIVSSFNQPRVISGVMVTNCSCNKNDEANDNPITTYKMARSTCVYPSNWQRRMQRANPISTKSSATYPVNPVLIWISYGENLGTPVWEENAKAQEGPGEKSIHSLSRICKINGCHMVKTWARHGQDMQRSIWVSYRKYLGSRQNVHNGVV